MKIYTYILMRNTVILFVLVLGLYFYVRWGGSFTKEGFVTKPRCPNLLIQKGDRYLLKNTSLAEVPGVNPISFANLNDYTQFVKWQRSQGIDCPVLFLQSQINAQGEEEYRIRPGPDDLRGGLSTISASRIAYNNQPNTFLFDAGRDDPPYNKNSFPAFDEQNQYIGDYTPLDKMFHSQEIPGELSEFPTDSNWGGAKYTRDAVDEGLYSSREIWVPKK